METPKGIGKYALAFGGLLGATWLGAAINSRRVARKNPAAASAGAALGGMTGALLATFTGASFAVTDSKWAPLGAATALLGTASFAIGSLTGLPMFDRQLVAQASGQPKALQLSESDSGKVFPMAVGDSLTIQLPAAQAGYVWSWAEGPAGILHGPVQTSAAVAGGTAEFDTFTASAAGTAQLTAQLVSTSTPADGTSTPAATATWQATIVVS